MIRALSVLLLCLTVIATPTLAQCDDDTDDDRIDDFDVRHPDDGSYIGVFSTADTSLDDLKLPLYSAASPFNQAIPIDAPLDPLSAERIEHLASEAYEETLIAVRAWSIAAYVADETTPRYDVALTACWTSYRVLYDVPIPDGALPDPVGDGGMAIIDLSTGYEYDFWQLEQLDDGSWQAGWGNRIALDGNGVFPYGMSARGSGFALLGGMIFPSELDAGAINHALIVTIPAPAAGGPVAPATESDGYSEHPLALPEGARIQLDPSLDLSTLNLDSWELVIAETLQTYGAIVADIGGNHLEFEAVNPISWASWRYPFAEPDFDYWETGAVGLNIPVEYFRVLAFPDPTDRDLRVADESIFGE